MTSVFKSLIFGCVVLLLAAAIKAAPQGFLEGHLKIVSLRAVEPSDEMPRSVVTAETYAEYPLIILSQDGQKEIARVTAVRMETIVLRCRQAPIFLMFRDAYKSGFALGASRSPLSRIKPYASI
jgi:hypothetical protein